MTSFTHQSVCRDDLSVVSFSDFGKVSTRGMKEEVKTPANDTVRCMRGHTLCGSSDTTLGLLFGI